MGFLGMPRHCVSKFLNKACLNTEGKHGYVLNASLSPTIHRSLADKQPSHPQNGLLAFSKHTQELEGKRSTPCIHAEVQLHFPGPSSSRRLAGQSPEAVAGLWAAVL